MKTKRGLPGIRDDRESKKACFNKDKAKNLMKGRMANYFSGSLTSSATSKLEMSSSPCSVSSHKRRRTGLLTKSKKPTLKYSLEALEDCNPIQHIQRLQQCWGKKPSMMFFVGQKETEERLLRYRIQCSLKGSTDLNH